MKEWCLRSVMKYGSEWNLVQVGGVSRMRENGNIHACRWNHKRKVRSIKKWNMSGDHRVRSFH